MPEKIRRAAGLSASYLRGSYLNEAYLIGSYSFDRQLIYMKVAIIADDGNAYDLPSNKQLRGALPLLPTTL